MDCIQSLEGSQEEGEDLQMSYVSCPLLRFLPARHAAYEERARLVGQGGAGLLHLGAL